MNDDPRQGLDERIDRALRRQTTPLPDPGFRAKVLARIDEPGDGWPAWAPVVRRVAIPVAAVAVCVVLAFLVRVAPEPPASRSAQGSTTTTEPAHSGFESVRPVTSASTESATAKRLAGSLDPGSEVVANTASDARLRARTRPLRAGMGAVGGAARALLPAPESTVSPSLALVDVGAVSVDPIEVQPLSMSERFTGLGEPAPIEVELVRVGAIGGR